MNTEKCVSWPNIEYEAGKKSIVLFQRHLGALTLVCLICHSGGRSRTNPQNVTQKNKKCELKQTVRMANCQTYSLVSLTEMMTVTCDLCS